MISLGHIHFYSGYTLNILRDKGYLRVKQGHIGSLNMQFDSKQMTGVVGSVIRYPFN